MAQTSGSRILRHLVFRRAELGDVPAIQELHVDALQAVDAYIHVDGYDADLDDIDAYYIAPGGEFLVACFDGDVVAMGGVMRRSAAIGEIRRMRVKQDLQGHG